MAPISAIDYVIVHELCHMKESTHSARFWETVKSFFPQSKKWKEWLRINGRLLELRIKKNQGSLFKYLIELILYKMPIQISFFKQIKERFIYQNYLNLEINLIAIKKKDKFHVLFLRIEYSDKLEEDYKVFHSLDNRAVIIQEIINEDKFIERIKEIEGKFVYLLDNIELLFEQKIRFPSNLEDFLNKISSKHENYLNITVEDDINLIYYDDLYNLKKFSVSGPIDLTDNTLFEEYEFIQLIQKFYNKKFLIKGNILNGRIFIESFFGYDVKKSMTPKLIIIFPLKTVKIRFLYSKENNNTVIKLELEIPESLKPILDVLYFKEGMETKIEKSEYEIIIEEDFSDIIDLIVLWNGDESFISKKTRLYWRQFSFFPFNKNNIEEIEVLETEINGLISSIDEDSEIDDKIKISNQIAEKYRLVRIRYEQLHNSGIFDYREKINDIENKRIETYQKFILYLEEKFNRSEIDFSYYLKLNNLLFNQYESNINSILERYSQRFESTSGFVTFGESFIPEINLMLLNINKAFSNVVKRVRNAFKNKDESELLVLFEILGDLHIHSAILNIIAPNGREIAWSSSHHFQNALESYLKSNEYNKLLSIPGVGRLSIRVYDYMKVFNIFMDKSELTTKIEYIKTFVASKRKKNKTESKIISSPSFDVESPLSNDPNIFIESSLLCLEAFNIIEDIIDNYKKLEKEKQDLYQFISQAPNPELQTALAILLSRVYLRTKNEIANDLKDVILSSVDSLDDIRLVLFNNVKMKSNELWNNLVPRVLMKKIIYIKPEDLMDSFKEINESQNYFYIFLDDIIGTGEQFLKNFNSDLNHYLSDLLEIKKEHSNVFFKIIAAIGSIKSKKTISENLLLFDFDDIVYKKIIREEDKAFYPKSWQNKMMLENLLRFLKQKHPKDYLGRKECQFLVITEYTYPNNTIGCLIYDSKNWKALFPRETYQ